MAQLTTIEIENFRIFCNKIKFDFAPITILTGSNNAGKSSLFKFLLLLKNSILSNKRLDILDFSSGRHYLGDFTNALCKNNTSQSETLSFSIPFPYLLQKNLTLHLEYSSADKTRRIYKPILNSVNLHDNELDKSLLSVKLIPYSDPNEYQGGSTIIGLYSFYFDTQLFKNYLEHVLQEREKRQEQIESYSRKRGMFRMSDIPIDYNDDYNIHDPFRERIKLKRKRSLKLNAIVDQPQLKLLDMDKLKEIQSLFTFIEEKPIQDQIYVTIDNLNEMQHDLDSNYPGLATWDHILYHFFSINLVSKAAEGTSTTSYKDVKRLFHHFVSDSIDYSFDLLSNGLFNMIGHLSSLRGNIERAYTQEGGVFNSLITEYAKLSTERRIGQLEETFISDWIINFGIEDFDHLSVNPAYDFNLNIVTLKKFNSERQLPLIDLGFGTSQLIAILLKIVIEANRNASVSSYQPHVLLIEEPESNLHPNWQALLADMFIDAAERFKTQFVIETHSEYLIRKLQYWTARKIINSEDTIIYYMHNLKDVASGKIDRSEQVKKITIQSDGKLDKEFGEGFFDEAVNLMMSIYKSSKNN